jgi:hypothetical protein
MKELRNVETSLTADQPPWCNLPQDLNLESTVKGRTNATAARELDSPDVEK